MKLSNDSGSLLSALDTGIASFGFLNEWLSHASFSGIKSIIKPKYLSNAHSSFSTFSFVFAIFEQVLTGQRPFRNVSL